MSEKKKHLFQIRRKTSRGKERDPFYSPERDLAHIGPNLAYGAMVSMEEKFWEPWLNDFMADNDVIYDDIVATEAPKKFAQAMNQIIKLENPRVAMEASGFADLPPAIQMLFYARFGQVALAAVWAGVKDVSQPDDLPPATLRDLLEDVEQAMDGILRVPDDEEEQDDDAAV